MGTIDTFLKRKEVNPTNAEKQHAAGKLTARERLEALFDKGTFVEVGSLVTNRCSYFGLDKKRIDGDGVITGYGTVDGRSVFAYAQDYTVLGGSLGEMHANKICNIIDMAYNAGCPVIGMNDSGGARIQEGVDGLSGYGRIFFRNVKASGYIPQITAIMGPCAGGAVYSPALTDFIFMTNNTGKMFITGPAVIKAVTGEDISADMLGGVNTHTRKSGVVHFACNSDLECIESIKRLLSYLPSNYKAKAPVKETRDDKYRKNPRLLEIVPEASNKMYDMRQVISEIVDDNEYMEYQQDFAPNMITCFAHMGGRSVGIIASQPRMLAGCVDINASEKAARFIRTCDAFGIPLVTLVDVPGYLPGKDQEWNGIIKHGAKLLYAYSEATVAKVTIILRKAFGGAFLAMCCKELGADVTYAWPMAEIAVMGAEGAADIIFKNEAPDEKREKTAEYKEQFLNPYKAAEHLLVDEVINPEDTRMCINRALDIFENKVREKGLKVHGNIPL